MSLWIGLFFTALQAAGENVHVFDPWGRDHLGGGWGGLRALLGEQGLTLEVTLTLEYIQNTKGGVRRDGAFLGNVDVTLRMDTTKANLWDNGTFYLYGLGNFNNGRLPTELVGDLQATSNIEAPESFKLFEAWYQHSFLDERLGILAGLHDYNSEFDVMEYAQLFANSSFGIAPNISQVGPSIFPTAALGVRLALNPTPDSYVLAALYDGVPGNPDDEKANDILLKSEDGIFYALELGLVSGEAWKDNYYKLALGGWYRTAKIEDIDGNEVDRNGGVYVLGEVTVYTEAYDGQGLGLFAQVGAAEEDRNEVAYSVMAGINYTGMLPERHEDVLGLGVSYAAISDDFRDLKEGARRDSAEVAMELIYHIVVTPWWRVQPDIQYIINPGSESGLDDALQVGIRTEIVF